MRRRRRKTSLSHPPKSGEEGKKPRAVIDTNVWISALLNPYGHPARVLRAFRNGLLSPILSDRLIDELVDVLARPRIATKYQLAAHEVAGYVALIVERSNIVQVSGTLHICRDPRDDVVLETALMGRAEYVVSRDDDVKRDKRLMDEMSRRGVLVLSIAQFLERIKGVGRD